MAIRSFRYRCPHCDFIRMTDFDDCPACGCNVITGIKTRESRYTM